MLLTADKSISTFLFPAGLCLSDDHLSYKASISVALLFVPRFEFYFFAMFSVMMMAAPNMAAGDMKFVGPYGQPMNMIKIEMPGPDGKMMQFYQFPTMAQGAMQPVVMASSVGGKLNIVRHFSYRYIFWYCLLVCW